MEATEPEGTELEGEDPTLPFLKFVLEFVLNAIPPKLFESTSSTKRAKFSCESVRDVSPAVMSTFPANSSRDDRSLC